MKQAASPRLSHYRHPSTLFDLHIIIQLFFFPGQNVSRCLWLETAWNGVGVFYKTKLSHGHSIKRNADRQNVFACFPQRLSNWKADFRLVSMKSQTSGLCPRAATITARLSYFRCGPCSTVFIGDICLHFSLTHDLTGCQSGAQQVHKCPRINYLSSPRG